MTLNKAFLACLFAGFSFTASADVLLIDVINKQPSNSEAGILRPVNGQSMSQVKALYGNADTTYPAIGNPPITRWNYTEFNVYFEHQLVIHSVLKQPKKAHQ